MVGVVVASVITRPALCASFKIFCKASWRFGQFLAAAQPSSMMSRSGPEPLFNDMPSRFIGWATAKIKMAASAKRNSNNHHGVLSGVSSCCFRPSKMRKGGNLMDCGRGGVNRSSHQMTGSANSPQSANGVSKLSACINCIIGRSHANVRLATLCSAVHLCDAQ